MRKTLIYLFLLGTAIACTVFPTDTESFEEKAGTQVAVALTATALDQLISGGDSTTVADTPEPEITPTEKPKDDPKSDLGDPSYADNCNSWSAWSVESKDQVLEDITTVSVADGKLSMVSSQPGKFHWWLNYRELADGYIEAKFETGTCSGSDAYGLVFRSPDYFNGVGYYFTLTCDGRYDLREKHDPNEYLQDDQMRFDLQTSDKIETGSGQQNTLGVWMEGEIIRLYINDYFINEIADAKVTASGHFGLFIYAKQTAGFKISLDEVSYWSFK